MILLTVAVGLFMYDNSEYLTDMKAKHQQGYEFK